jgi:hypothetical protein
VGQRLFINKEEVFDVEASASDLGCYCFSDLPEAALGEGGLGEESVISEEFSTVKRWMICTRC